MPVQNILWKLARQFLGQSLIIQIRMGRVEARTITTITKMAQPGYSAFSIQSAEPEPLYGC